MEYYNSVTNIDDFFWLICLIAARFYGAMSICPLFNSAWFTKLLKLVLSALCAAIIFPYVQKKTSLPASAIYKLVLLIKELLFGVVLSYIFSLPFWLIENVGNILDTQRGEQFGAIINKSTNHPSSSIANLLLQCFITYIVTMNGMLFFFEVVFHSFKVIFIDQMVPVNPFYNSANYILYFTKYCYWLTMLVLPLIFICFIIDIIFGILSAFISSLNSTVTTMPIKSAVVIFMLIFYLGALYHVNIREFFMPIRDYLISI